MSTCEKNDAYQQFLEFVDKDLGQVDVEDFHPLILKLQLLADAHGFEHLAAQVKKYLVQHKEGMNHIGLLARRPEMWRKGSTLLGCFGRAFGGHEVGLLGADILSFSFTIKDLRKTASKIALRWLDDDEVWIDFVEDRARGLLRLGEETLGRRLMARVKELEEVEEEYTPAGLARAYVRAFGLHPGAVEELEEELKKDPDVEDFITKNLEQVQQDEDIHCWGGSDGEQTSGTVFSYCNWGGDQIKELVDAEQTLVDETLLDDEEEVEEEPDPQLEAFFEIKRKRTNRISARLETSAVPKFMSYVDIEMPLAIDLLESSKIGQPSHRRTELEVEVRPLRHGQESLVYVWDKKGSFCLTLEPTATKDRWLIFLNQ
jgi:hypothetical protein